MDIRSYWPSSPSWRTYWPGAIISLIATLQLIISFIILVIHIAIVTIGALYFCFGAAPWFIMGFICWGIFFVSWISIFCVSCCNRQSVGCATYAMVTNILTFIFSAVLINFDRRVINPDESSGSYVYGNSFRIDCVSASSSKSNDQTDWGNIMLGLTKGQLAGGVLMLVSALTFIGIYVYVYIRALQHDGRMPSSFVTGPSRAPPAPQSATYQVPYSGPSKNTVSLGGGSRVIVCPNCGPIAEESGRF